MWMVSLSQTGRISEAPKRISQGYGSITQFTGSADGKVLTFLRENWSPSTYIAVLTAGGTQLIAPRRLTLEWRIGGTWVIETDPAAISEIDVTFTPEGDATRVTLEHRHLDRHTEAEALRGAVGSEGGWPGLLKRYSDAVG